MNTKIGQAAGSWLTTITLTLVAGIRAIADGDRSATDDNDRGDVPGWVLITVMTAGLVAALWAVAGDALSTMLQDALNSVKRSGRANGHSIYNPELCGANLQQEVERYTGWLSGCSPVLYFMSSLAHVLVRR